MLRLARSLRVGVSRGRICAPVSSLPRATAPLCQPRCAASTMVPRATTTPLHCTRPMHSAAPMQIAAEQPATIEATAPTALPSQQQRWEAVRDLATRLLEDSSHTTDAQQPAAPEWIVWPSLRLQAGPSAALHAAAKAAEAEAGEAFTPDEQRELQSQGEGAEEAAASALSAAPTLSSSQSLAPSLYSEPHLVMPQVARMWRRLAQIDRAAMRRAEQRSKGAVIDVAPAAPEMEDPDAAASSSAPVWSSRGLFLDGPQGIGKSSALYALTCLARASGWMAVHISDADAWVGQLGSADGAGANRMLVQAIYEAAANCVLPSTALWSSPHSLLQLPLSPSLEYTSILEDQGITSFGELLVLALGLEDGSEEAELAVECIWAQLQSMDAAGVPVLICVDGFDALTQRCFRPAQSDVDAEDALIAPLSTSPFSWLNYHRSKAFRGGFVLSGESFALVSQAHPELMEQPASHEDDEQTGMGAEGDEFGFSSSATGEERTKTAAAAAASSHPVDPIQVVPLPPLSSVALCRAYILDRVARSPELRGLATFFGALPPSHSLWSFVFHRLTSGHFGMIDSMMGMEIMRQIGAVGGSDKQLPSERAMWDAFVEARTMQTLQRFSSLFPSDAAEPSSSSSSSSLQRSLAGFFLAHLPSGFYRDFLRNAGRAGGGGRIGRERHHEHQQELASTVARDYNLIAINEVESFAQIQWIQSMLLRDKQNHAASSNGEWTSSTSAAASATSSFVTDSSAWGMLTADLPWDALSKDQLLLVRASKAEALQQLVAMGVILQSKGGAVPLTSLVSRSRQGEKDAPAALSLPLRSLQHWCPSKDPPILSAADLSSQSLQLHWSLPDSIVDASSRAGIEAAGGSGGGASGAVEHLARVAHVLRTAEDTAAAVTTITLFLPILDSKHLGLMMSNNGGGSSSPSAPHQLIHTLHLHQLSEVLQSFQMLVGPAFSVVAVSSTGRRVTWSELEAMIDAMQAGQAGEGEMPLMHATIDAIEAQPLIDGGDAAAPVPSNVAHIPKLRLVIVSPHSGVQPTTATDAATAASATSLAPNSAAASAPAPAPARQFHALFDFASAILGSDFADMLTIPTAELAQIRWK